MATAKQMAVRKAFAQRAKAGTLKKGSKLSISGRVRKAGSKIRLRISRRRSGTRSRSSGSIRRGAASTYRRARAADRPAHKTIVGTIVKVKMAQGAAAPFVYPFAQAGLAGAGPAAIAQASNEVARRIGIEISSPTPAFVLGNIGVTNTPNQANAGGGLLTTLGAEAMNVAVEGIDKALHHRAGLARGNVFDIADEAVPLLMAGQNVQWQSTPQALLQAYRIYNVARSGYDPATHSVVDPASMAFFGPRLAAKAGLWVARRLTTGMGFGKYLNLRHFFKGAA